MILRSLALETKDALIKSKYRNDALGLLNPILDHSENSHIDSGVVQLLIDDIKERSELKSEEDTKEINKRFKNHLFGF